MTMVGDDNLKAAKLDSWSWLRLACFYHKNSNKEVSFEMSLFKYLKKSLIISFFWMHCIYKSWINATKCIRNNISCLQFQQLFLFFLLFLLGHPGLLSCRWVKGRQIGEQLCLDVHTCCTYCTLSVLVMYGTFWRSWMTYVIKFSFLLQHDFKGGSGILIYLTLT